MLPEPLPPDALLDLAAQLGADVPFFLNSGPQLGTGTGTDLAALDLPQDYWVLLVLPDGERKRSTADVYTEFDGRGTAERFDERLAALTKALEQVRRPRDLAALPANAGVLAARGRADRARSFPGRCERRGTGGLRPVPPPRGGGRCRARIAAARAHVVHGSDLVRLSTMAANESLEHSTIEHGKTKWGRWLRARRIRITLWIAVLEGIIVAVSPSFTKWTVIAIAVPVLVVYVIWGRNAGSDTSSRSPGSPVPLRRSPSSS